MPNYDQIRWLSGAETTESDEKDLLLMKNSLGFISGLGVIVGVFLSVIFLTSLLIVQPLDIPLRPKRMWMHQVTFDWVFASISLAAVSAVVFGILMKMNSKAASRQE